MNWSDDYSVIGAALANRYPRATPMTMSPSEVQRHVADLPGFDPAAAAPPAHVVAAIGFAWIRAAADDPEEAADRF